MDRSAKAERTHGAAERPEFRRAHLATLFMRASRPLSTPEIVRQVYNNPTNLELGKMELSAESAHKALKRDIDALKATGLIIESAGKDDGGHSLWQVNKNLSFTQGIDLSEEDAAFLDIACLPLLNDPGFPERDELRLALAKIDRLFDAAATGALTATVVRDSPALVAVREALNTRTALDIAYRSRGGAATVRRVAPLAFFDLRSVLYVVCAPVDDGGNVAAESARTYRVDRIEDAKRVARISYEIPESFDVNGYKKLPFQIGDERFTAAFHVPEDRAEPLEAEMQGRGSLRPAEHGRTWAVEAADLEGAAAWAIAYGIRPLDPPELAHAWRRRLEEVLHG